MGVVVGGSAASDDAGVGATHHQVNRPRSLLEAKWSGVFGEILLVSDQRSAALLDFCIELGSGFDEEVKALLVRDVLDNIGPSKCAADGEMTLNNDVERIILPQQHSKKGTPTPPNNSTSKKSSRYYQVPLIYCDQTASNRAVKSIENYIQNVCLPLYGNTHTNTSLTGSQSTAFVAEARQCIAEQTNAKVTGKASLDVVLFA